MWKPGRLYTITLAWIACIHYSVDSADPTCVAGVAVLGSEYTIQGDRSNYTGFLWVRPTDDRYVVTCNPSCSPVAGYSATVNGTHATLTIDSVGMVDAGTWKIVDANVVGAIPVDVCQLTVAKLPRCNVSSDADPTALQPNTNLTLTVDIREYYCSQEAGFYLTTGNVTEMLMKHNVTDVSDVITSSTFSVTPARLGDVIVSYTCDVTRWDLNCDGVRILVMGVDSADPTCVAGVAPLSREYTIQGDRSNYTGLIWVRPSDGRYVVTCNPTCSPVAGYSATVNDTHSSLTVHSVGVVDAGTWKIVDGTTVSSIPVGVCQLTVAKLPRCNVSSDADPTALQPNTNLTLTVDIREYYCSQEAGFYLTTGNVTEMLMKHNVTDVSDVITSSTFSVTPARLGDVTVSYTCDVSRWDLNCDGVRSLVMDLVGPTEFYCTRHTQSSLDIQWLYPRYDLYNLAFVLNYRLNDKADIDDRNITIPTEKYETIYTTTLTELQEDNLYHFRLVVDGGYLGQSEAVNTTCFTRRSEGSESSESSMGVGVVIGIGVTLVALALCLGVAFVFRRKLTAIYSGTDSAEKDRISNPQISQTSQERTSSANNQTEEGAYEAPSPQNPYDDLQPRSFAEIETSNTYEQLKQYQNVSH